MASELPAGGSAVGLDNRLDALEGRLHAPPIGASTPVPEDRPVQPESKNLRQVERLGDVGAIAVRLELVAPSVDGLGARSADSEGKVAVLFADRDFADRPVGRADAVAFDVASELGADCWAGGAVQPLRLKRLGAE